jgi:hypothetical protein
MWYVPSDTYNVERFDFSLGSNSLMFGDSAPGGQVTIYTKRPQFRNFGSAFGSVASFGTSRLSLDVNVAVNKRFALRVNAVNRVDSSYIHHTYQRQKAADLALLFRPFKTTTLMIEGERGKQVRRRGENALAILDASAPGLALNQNNRWYFTSDGTIYQRPSSAIAGADTTAASGNSVSLLSGQAVAVALPGGLITPIIRNAESKSLSAISNEMRDLAARARAHKLKPHEYQGGTTSVSNLGMYGIKDFTAVINPPQSTILAVGTGEERAVVRNGKIEAAHIMSVTMSCDHRAVDGALGAVLIGAFKALIENPVMMLV